MRIQHNIMAMSAYRNYNNNTSAVAKNLEKLSSGYKINRAGDDAAGLAISEKMRAQITGLNAAQKNVKDGISLVKTAEGAMQEIQDMLNRMDYLATQSANGTYDNDVDRANLQKEVDALKTEINRIADSANFNGIKLLDGTQEKVAAGSKSISGSERILSAVIGEGEDAWAVTGNKTVLDTPSASATAGEFQVDMTTLKFTAFGTSSSSLSFTFKIGDATFTATASGVAGTATSDTIMKAVASALASAMGTTTTINNVKWSVSNSNGVLTFTQQSKPINKDQAQCNFDVSFSAEKASASATSGVIVTSSHLEGTQVTTQAIAPQGANMANTVFKINESDIRDGTTITIGTRTITLAVGANSKYYSTATTVVDLRDMEEDNIDLNKALGAISATYGTTANVQCKANNGTDATATFTVGVSDGSDGKAIGITIQRKTAISTASDSVGAYFNTKDRLSAVFGMKVATKEQKGLTLQIGDTSDSYNQMTVSVKDMHTDAMGIAGIDISNQEGAAAAVQTIRDAINYVSGVRGDLGAVQNRLEHTANNLSVMAENIQDAESTIRDTDIAEEMMSYTKNNILVQSAQAMLAQANQVPQGVLQLLG